MDLASILKKFGLLKNLTFILENYFTDLLLFNPELLDQSSSFDSRFYSLVNNTYMCWTLNFINVELCIFYFLITMNHNKN